MEEKRTKDYANGKIYAIYNYIDPSLVYVGSTCQSLSKRLSKHRREMNSKQSQTKPFYMKMREICKEQFYIELLEEYPCENNEQLRAREGHYIREMKASLNGRIEGRTMEEWREENKERLKEYRKVKYNNIKEEYLAFRRMRFVCECGSEISNGSKLRHLRSKKHQAYLNQQNEN